MPGFGLSNINWCTWTERSRSWTIFIHSPFACWSIRLINKTWDELVEKLISSARPFELHGFRSNCLDYFYFFTILIKSDQNFTVITTMSGIPALCVSFSVFYNFNRRQIWGWILLARKMNFWHASYNNYQILYFKRSFVIIILHTPRSVQLNHNFIYFMYFLDPNDHKKTTTNMYLSKIKDECVVARYFFPVCSYFVMPFNPVESETETCGCVLS